MKKIALPIAFLVIGLIVGVLLGYSSQQKGFVGSSFISSDDLSDLSVSTLAMIASDMNGYRQRLVRERKPYLDIRAFIVPTETGHRLDFVYWKNSKEIDEVVNLIHGFVWSRINEIRGDVPPKMKDTFEPKDALDKK